MNNDTEFAPCYVETLVRHSLAHNAALCGVVVDADNPDRIIDAGVKVDWPNYAFRGQYERPESGVLKLDSCVLPGRGTVIPISAVRLAGTIDDVRFPHYLADYEFTYRVRTKGNIRLGVAFDAEIATRVETEKPIVLNPLAEGWMLVKDSVSRRSKRNIFDHYNFIDAHAPGALKRSLKRTLLRRHLARAITPTYHRLDIPKLSRGTQRAKNAVRSAPRLMARKLSRLSHGAARVGARFVVLPIVRQLGLDEQRVKKVLRRGPRSIANKLASLRRGAAFAGARFVPATVVRRLGLDEQTLRDLGIVRACRLEGYLRIIKPESFVREHYPQALALYPHSQGTLRLIGPLVRAEPSGKPPLGDVSR